MTAPSYRYATTDDIPAVRALIEVAYRGPESAKGWKARRISHRRADQQRGGPELDREPDAGSSWPRTRANSSGCVLLEKHGDDGYFGMFSVDPRAPERAGWARPTRRSRAGGARSLGGEGHDRRSSSTSAMSSSRGTSGGATRSPMAEPFPFDEHSGALRTDFAFVELRKSL